LNIGFAQGASILVGTVNGLMAQPLLLRWNGMRWKPKRAMNTRPMSILEAETESAEMMAESHTLQRWEDVKCITFFVWNRALIGTVCCGHSLYAMLVGEL